MRLVSTLLVFAGYTFVYASVAAGGRFATEPWAGLFADAYTPDPNQQRQAGGAIGTIAGNLFSGQGGAALGAAAGAAFANGRQPIRPRGVSSNNG